jgi:aldehyde dehydrogenase (NAD+)
MASTGQKCTATSRLIVQRSVADGIVEELRRLADGWVVGDGLKPDVKMGPAVSQSAKDDILRSVEDAVAQGATVLTGGDPYRSGALAEGAFVPPSVLEVPDANATVWREEIFGPVLALLTVDSADEAYKVANDSPFGLSASVFTNDLRHVAEAIERLEVGVVHVNSETSGAEPHVPFGGIKQSGYGPHEQGRAAREFFTDTVTVYSRPLEGGHS